MFSDRFGHFLACFDEGPIVLKQWTLNELFNPLFSRSARLQACFFSCFLKSRLLCLSIAAYSVFITQRGKVSRLEGNTKQFLCVDIAERWTRRLQTRSGLCCPRLHRAAFIPRGGVQRAALLVGSGLVQTSENKRQLVSRHGTAENRGP